MPNSFSGIGNWASVDADWRESKPGITGSLQTIGNSIAPPFDTASTYVSGDAVMYSDSRYVCTATTVGPGEWESSAWSARSVQQDIVGATASVSLSVSYDSVNEELCLDFSNGGN